MRLRHALRFSLFVFWFSPPWLTLSTSTFVYYLQSHKLQFSATFLLKIDLTVLFTHLKIILLQFFQFQFLILAKISSIQIHSYLPAFPFLSLFFFFFTRIFPWATTIHVLFINSSSNFWSSLSVHSYTVYRPINFTFQQFFH